MERAGYVILGGVNYPIKRVFSNVAASQVDAVLVAGVALKKIHVISLIMLAGAVDTSILFNSKPVGAGVAISMTFQNLAGGGVVLPRNPDGWFNTAVGEGLSVTTGVGAVTGIQINYIERE